MLALALIVSTSILLVGVCGLSTPASDPRQLTACEALVSSNCKEFCRRASPTDNYDHFFGYFGTSGTAEKRVAYQCACFENNPPLDGSSPRDQSPLKFSTVENFVESHKTAKGPRNCTSGSFIQQTCESYCQKRKENSNPKCTFQYDVSSTVFGYTTCECL